VKVTRHQAPGEDHETVPPPGLRHEVHERLRLILIFKRALPVADAVVDVVQPSLYLDAQPTGHSGIPLENRKDGKASRVHMLDVAGEA
jgi:hypothetical protein